jgi:hypothetical protein
MAKLAGAFLRRDMIQLMSLLQSELLRKDQPPATHPVLLSSRVPTAAAEAIVFHSHSVLGFLE